MYDSIKSINIDGASFKDGLVKLRSSENKSFNVYSLILKSMINNIIALCYIGARSYGSLKFSIDELVKSVSTKSFSNVTLTYELLSIALNYSDVANDIEAWLHSNNIKSNVTVYSTNKVYIDIDLDNDTV